MPPKAERKRGYHSAARQAQASRTRRRILAAAGRLFAGRGYAGANMQAIAVEAGVGMQTIYAIFKSKPLLLVELFNAASAPHGEEHIPVPERATPRKVAREGDQRKQIRMFAQVVADNLQGAAPVGEIMVDAAGSEPEIQRVWQILNKARLEHLMVFVEQLRANGPLRPGIDADTALDIVWTLASPEVFLLLVRERGWSKESYASWMAETLIHALLPQT